MTKFRFGVSDIEIHRKLYRYNYNLNVLCKLCGNSEENELHFVLCCPFYKSIREQLIAPKFWKSPNMFRLQILLSSRNENTIKNLCVFLYKAFNVREIALS